MVFRKRTRKRTYRRKKTYRKKPNLVSQVHRFKRTVVDQFTIPMDGVISEYYEAWSFKLSDLPSYTEFTALYDQYCIEKIVCKFFPRFNVYNYPDATSAETEVPIILSVIDYDDATAVSQTSLVQFSTCKYHSQFKPFTITFSPRAATAAYSGAFTSYAVASKNQWFDAASSDVQYYGLKLATSVFSGGNNPTVDPTWDVYYEYHLAFRFPR